MVIVVSLFLALSLTRGILTYYFNIFPLGDSHLVLLIPDVVFFLISSFYLFKKSKKTFDPFVILFLIGFLGSIVWDYQYGFYLLKYLFPGILFIILNREVFHKSSFKELVLVGGASIFMPFPFLALLSLSDKFKKTKTENLAQMVGEMAENTKKSKKSPFALAVFLGVILGLFILILLAGLDPEFAKFISPTFFKDIILNSFASLLYYVFTFLFFFVIPVSAKWVGGEASHSILKLLQFGVFIIVSIIVGYSLYDAYIVLKAFRILSLTFESIGKNTQLSFLELVALGGFWLFIASFILDRIKAHPNKKEESHVKEILSGLFISFIFLVPPVLNILRVLLYVYIPRFGFTTLRLFGVYTTIAFLCSLVAVVFCFIKDKKRVFPETLLTFMLVLFVLTFSLPNNVFVANWHLKKYLNNEEVDFTYFRKLRIEKWGLFLEGINEFNPDEHKSDALWGLLIANRTKNVKMQKLYRDSIKSAHDKEIGEVVSLIESQDFSKLISNHSSRGFSIYKGESLKGLRLKTSLNTIFSNLGNTSDEDVFPKLGFSDIYDTSRFAETINVEVFYNPPTGIRPVYERNIKRSFVNFSLNFDRKNNRLLNIENELFPFWAENFKARCENDTLPICGLNNKGYCKAIAKDKDFMENSIPQSLVEMDLSNSYYYLNCF